MDESTVQKVQHTSRAAQQSEQQTVSKALQCRYTFTSPVLYVLTFNRLQQQQSQSVSNQSALCLQRTVACE